MSFTKFITDMRIYDAFLQRKIVETTLMNAFIRGQSDIEPKVKSKGIIRINDFSKSFAEVCFREDLNEK